MHIIKKIKDWIYHPPEIVVDGFGEYWVRKGWFFSYDYFSFSPYSPYTEGRWRGYKILVRSYTDIKEAKEALESAERNDLLDKENSRKSKIKDRIYND